MIFKNCFKFHSPIGSYNNSEISLVVFVPNIATNHAITYTNNVNSTGYRRQNGQQPRSTGNEVAFVSVEQEKIAEDFTRFAK